MALPFFMVRTCCVRTQQRKSDYGLGRVRCGICCLLRQPLCAGSPSGARFSCPASWAAGFTLAYSALSLAVLTWVIGAAGRAPYVPLWQWAPWQNHVVLVVMALVCLLLALSIGRPNPFSFGGARNQDFDPHVPGIIRLHRHPLLLALGLWAFAHTLPNGDLAHVILFGVFGVFFGCVCCSSEYVVGGFCVWLGVSVVVLCVSCVCLCVSCVWPVCVSFVYVCVCVCVAVPLCWRSWWSC